MGDSKVLAIALASFTTAILRGAISSYKAWKLRRSTLGYEARNAGWLITDRNLSIFEKSLVIFATIFVGWMIYNTLWWIAIAAEWEYVYLLPRPF